MPYICILGVAHLLCRAHTTQLNPAKLFTLLRAYRAVYRLVEAHQSWDAEMSVVLLSVRNALDDIGAQLIGNKWWHIADYFVYTNKDDDYDAIICTDASKSGWGIITKWRNGATRTYQHRWVHDLQCTGTPQGEGSTNYFTAQHSAHAEPRAIIMQLHHLTHKYLQYASASMKTAVMTDHFPIVLVQRKENGYGAIGSGYALNKLFELTSNFMFNNKINVVFFYVAGELNPAEALLRNFAANRTNQIMEDDQGDISVPLLR